MPHRTLRLVAVDVHGRVHGGGGILPRVVLQRVDHLNRVRAAGDLRRRARVCIGALWAPWAGAKVASPRAVRPAAGKAQPQATSTRTLNTGQLRKYCANFSLSSVADVTTSFSCGCLPGRE